MVLCFALVMLEILCLATGSRVSTSVIDRVMCQFIDIYCDACGFVSEEIMNRYEKGKHSMICAEAGTRPGPCTWRRTRALYVEKDGRG